MTDCWCDYDPPEFSSRSYPKARKQHRCEECGKPINPGEQYECVAGKWDGYFSTFNTCPRCVDLRRWVTNSIPCFCWAHGNMLDDAREAVDQARIRARDETAGLWFGFLRRLYAVKRPTA